MRRRRGPFTLDWISRVGPPRSSRYWIEVSPSPCTTASAYAASGSSPWRIRRAALRWALPPLPTNRTSAASVTSPEAFFQAKWKASVANHMFSPPPVTV